MEQMLAFKTKGNYKKRNQKYEIVIQPPSSYVAFSGQGIAMSKNEDTKSDISFNKNAPPPLAKPGDETIKFYVRFSNGEKKEIIFPKKGKIKEIYDYVRTISNSKTKFSLLSGFPPSPLDPNSNIESQDLNNALIIQKIE